MYWEQKPSERSDYENSGWSPSRSRRWRHTRSKRVCSTGSSPAEEVAPRIWRGPRATSSGRLARRRGHADETDPSGKPRHVAVEIRRVFGGRSAPPTTSAISPIGTSGHSHSERDRPAFVSAIESFSITLRKSRDAFAQSTISTRNGRSAPVKAAFRAAMRAASSGSPVIKARSRSEVSRAVPDRREPKARASIPGACSRRMRRTVSRSAGATSTGCTIALPR